MAKPCRLAAAIFSLSFSPLFEPFSYTNRAGSYQPMAEVGPDPHSARSSPPTQLFFPLASSYGEVQNSKQYA